MTVQETKQAAVQCPSRKKAPGKLERPIQGSPRSLLLRRVTAIALCVALLLSSALAGCSRDSRAIKIGAAGPFTGELSKIGLDSLNALKMAVDEVNQEGGIDGRRVEIVTGDDGGDPAKGSIVASKFVSDPSILGVIGPMNSNVVNATLPVYDKAGLVLISQSATSKELTSRGFKVFHRICPRDDAQGKAAALFIANELKPQRIFMLDDKSTYGQGLSQEVEEALTALGKFEVKRAQISEKDKDFAAIISVMKQFNPDLVFMGLSNPAQAANLARQMNASRLSPKLMAGDGCKEKDQLIGVGGEAVQGMYVTSIGRDVKEVPEGKEFAEKFEAKYGPMSVFSGQTYEAAKILLAAMKNAAQAKNLTRDGVLRAVHSTENYQGILGFPITFDEKGDITQGEILVFAVKGRDFAEVKTYATGDLLK